MLATTLELVPQGPLSIIWTHLNVRDLRRVWIAGISKANIRKTVQIELANREFVRLPVGIRVAVLTHCKENKTQTNGDWKLKIARAVHLYLEGGHNAQTRLEASKDNSEVTEFLPESVLKVFENLETHSQALIASATAGLLEEVVLELGKNEVWIEASDQDGYTALTAAAKKGHNTVVKTLLLNRANINAANCKGRTALHLAAIRGHIDVMNTLLTHGADVNAIDCYGDTALTTLLLVGEPNQQKKLREKQTQRTAILLKHKANVNVHSNGLPTISSLLGWMNPEVLKLLLENGVDANVKVGDDPLICNAVSQCKRKVVEVLLEHGADVNSRNWRDATLLTSAVRRGSTKIVKILLTYGADPKRKVGGSNSNQLHVAAWHGKVDILKVLLDSGVSPDTVNDDGYTPLKIAMERKKIFAQDKTTADKYVDVINVLKNYRANDCSLDDGAQATAWGRNFILLLLGAAILVGAHRAWKSAQ